MTEEDFINECEHLLDRIEDAIDEAGLDVDFERSGHVLQVEFEQGAQLVVNGQAPMREIWLASPLGAHHFRKQDDHWIDTRSGEGLGAVLSRAVGTHAGQQVILPIG